MAPKSVVLLGDVGQGKSTLVEKIFGVKNLSSDASVSFTRSSEAFTSECRQLQIIDTPGSNAMADKLEHNVWIAHALNTDPVSLILMVVKAETRIDNAVAKVREYAERFGDLIDIMAVCITHMDTVKWDQAEFKKALSDELGIERVIFVGTDNTGCQIKADILRNCPDKPMDLMITSENFLKYFKINNNNMKILKTVREEVARFQIMQRDFASQLKSGSYQDQEKVDLVFEFQAFMGEEVYQAQKRVSEANSFTFLGDATANEAGHIANLTNQLRASLFEVRTMALAYQSNAGISNLRKCPHCNLVWAKLEGCDGDTTCGNKPSSFDGRFTILANFHFEYDGEHLRIRRAGQRPTSAASSSSSKGNAGCGRAIAWKDMAPVQVPSEFNVQTVVTTDDVGYVPEEAKAEWDSVFSNVAEKLGMVKKRNC